MRSQHRNKQILWYSNYIGKRPVIKVDDNGKEVETGDYSLEFSEPIRFKCVISAEKGETTTRQFGDSETYDKVLSFTGKSPMRETSRIWIDNLENGKIPTNLGENIAHDYLVSRVAESLNSTQVLLTKVAVSQP